MSWPSRLSFNQFCSIPRQFDELVDEAARAGVAGIGVNRRLLSSFGFDRAVKLVRDAGIPVTSYTAIGYWASGYDMDGTPRTEAENIRDLDRAVEFGTELVCVSPGGLARGDKDLTAARARSLEGVAKLAEQASQRNLRLIMEPLHPVYSPYQSILHTLDEAMDIIDVVKNESLGILMDTFHTWWHPRLAAQLQRARDRIFLIQINDWSPEHIARTSPFDRDFMGDGVMDYSVFYEGLKDYKGWLEAEIFSDETQAMSLPQIFDKLQTSYQKTFATAFA